ncbi:hypothetical protein E2C01_069628 [Portunus trituberculatus]|uniref:Uncharacterized protein n=1 Tax=Portunus trituberculatus TaxID=210409 RepID=A0A5B7I3B3_PORTR|nr:hypothetical protein [Portunus trituberculatus]
MTNHGREQVPHPGEASCEDALVLTAVGTQHLYGIPTIEHSSHAPCGLLEDDTALPDVALFANVPYGRNTAIAAVSLQCSSGTRGHSGSGQGRSTACIHQP